MLPKRQPLYVQILAGLVGGASAGVAITLMLTGSAVPIFKDYPLALKLAMPILPVFAFMFGGGFVVFTRNLALLVSSPFSASIAADIWGEDSHGFPWRAWGFYLFMHIVGVIATGLFSILLVLIGPYFIPVDVHLFSVFAGMLIGAFLASAFRNRLFSS